MIEIGGDKERARIDFYPARDHSLVLTVADALEMVEGINVESVVTVGKACARVEMVLVEKFTRPFFCDLLCGIVQEAFSCTLYPAPSLL